MKAPGQRSDTKIKAHQSPRRGRKEGGGKGKGEGGKRRRKR
jgi:hypothetical protein